MPNTYTYTPAQLAEIQTSYNQQDWETAYLKAAFYADGGADPNVIAWLNGAAEINSGDGAASDFVRNYTAAQHLARYGTALGSTAVQDVSDAIAQKVIFDILNSGETPTIEQIIDDDATPAAEILLLDDPAGWAGNPMFLALGQSAPLDNNVLHDTGDTYDALAMVKFGLQEFGDLWDSLLQNWPIAALNAGTVTGGLSDVGSYLGDAYGTFAVPDAMLRNIVLGQINASDTLSATSADDLIHGGGGNDTISPTGDGDIIDGGSGADEVSYASATASLTVTITPHRNSTADFIGEVEGSATDRLYGVEKVTGGSYADEFNVQNLSGSDISIALDGAGGSDTLNLENLTAGVTLSLTSGILSDGSAVSFTIQNFENYIGTDQADKFTINSSVLSLGTGAGNDSILAHSNSAWIVDGGDGVDILDFSNANSGILFSGSNVQGVEQLAGSAFADTLSGIRVIIAGGGNDSVSAIETGGIIVGGSGNDTLNGGEASDHLYAGSGENVLIGEDGADYFHIQKNDLISQNYISNVESADLLIWNGYQLRGGLLTLIDAEFPQYQYNTYTEFMYEDIAYLGEYGEIYRWDASSGTIDITTPDESHIHVSGFSMGEMGITFANRTPVGTHESSWFWSNIVNNGVGDTENLTGRAGALATVGPFGDLSTPGASGDDSLVGSSADDALDGGAGNDTIAGGAGRDALFGGAGTDSINGGFDNDNMVGGEGDDVYNIAATDGDDVIIESASSGDVDVINFADVTSSDAKLTLVGNDLVITNTSGSFHVIVVGFSLAGGAGIEKINFSDAVTWLRSDILSHVAVGGGSSNDTLIGTAAADAMSAGEGNDVLYGLQGGDIYSYETGNGDDRIVEDSASAGTDRLVLGAGLDSSDAIVGRSGSADLLLSFSGVSGSVTIDGGFSTGLAGVEEVEFGDAVVWTKAQLRDAYFSQSQTVGNDTLSGFQGSTTVELPSFAGDDHLVEGFDPSGVDRLVFGSGMDSTNVVVSRSSSSLDDVTISFGGPGASLRLKDQFLGGGRGIEEIEFDDNVVWSAAQLRGAYLAQAQTAGSDSIYGYSGSTNFAISGLAGNDVLIEAANASDVDRLVLSSGLNPGNLIATQSVSDADDVILSFTGYSGSLTLDEQLATPSGAGFEEIEFGNGTIWTRVQLVNALGLSGGGGSTTSGTSGNDSLTGTSSAETLFGGAGNDTVSGAGGSDTYLFNSGDGNDQYNEGFSSLDTDLLALGAGLTTSGLSLTRTSGAPDDITLIFSGGAGSVKLTNEFSGTGSGFENIRFGDGTVWSRTELQSAYLERAQTGGSDTVIGFVGSTNFIVNSLAGNDVLHESYSSTSTDRLIFGPNLSSSALSIARSASTPNDAVLSFAGSSGSIRLYEEFSGTGSNSGFEEIEFANGEVWTRAKLQEEYLARAQTSGNDSIMGFVGSTDIHVSSIGGNDIITESYSSIYTDRLMFDAQFNPDSAILTRSMSTPGDLVLSFSGMSGSFRIVDEFSGTGNSYGFEQFEFRGGTTWSRADIQEVYLERAQTTGDDSIIGFSGSTTFEIGGLAGNDVLIEGLGSTDTDRLVFGSGLNADNVVLTRSASSVYDITFSFGSGGGSLKLSNEFWAGGFGFEEIEFGDSTVWTRSELKENYLAKAQTAGNDTIVGFEGATTFAVGGPAGNDVLIEGLSWTDTDRLVLGNGLNPGNVILTRSAADAYDITLSFTGVSGSLKLVSEFWAGGFGFEEIEFGDSTVWSRATLQANYITKAQTSANDIIAGFEDSGDVIGALQGDDTISGLGGADTLSGGAGADVLNGGGGVDRFVFASSSDSTPVTRDVINDFGAGEKIDLSALNFTWIGTAAFSGAAGELRYHTTGVSRYVSGDEDGDGFADFQVQILGTGTLAASDFIL